MAHPALIPLGLLFGGMYLLTKEDGRKQAALVPGQGQQPQFTPGAADSLTEMKVLPDGTQARYFRPEIRDQIMGMLASRGIEPVQVQGGAAPGLLYRLTGLSVPGVTAQVAAQTANTQGVVVMASLSIAMVSSPVDKFLMFAPPAQRGAANSSGQFAILLDAGVPSMTGIPTVPGVPGGLPIPGVPGGIPIPGVPGVPGVPFPPSPFDFGMDPEIVRQVNAYLSDPDADPVALETAAKDLEASGYPVAAKALRDRAAALRLKQKMKDSQMGTPFLIRGNASGLAVDLPFNTAKHYTADGNRWREIAAVNPHHGMVVTNGNLSPWKAGMTILLPLSWGAASKPLPKPLGVPKKK